MKRIILSLGIAFLSIGAFAQENIFTISSGYAFANPENYSNDATGYRINGLIEMNPMQGKFAHGFSLGYIHTKASQDVTVGNNTSSSTVKLNTFPVYYAPKVMLGNGKVKGFVKGAIGLHFSTYKLEGALVDEGTTNDVGFYGGAGLGGMYNISETMFVNCEYEWAYLSNSWYGDGFMNTAQIGLGFRF